MIWAVLLLHLCKFIWLGHCLLYFAPLRIDFCPDDMEAHPGSTALPIVWTILPVLAESGAGGGAGAPHGWLTVNYTATHPPAPVLQAVEVPVLTVPVHGAAPVLLLSEAVVTKVPWPLLPGLPSGAQGEGPVTDSILHVHWLRLGDDGLVEHGIFVLIPNKLQASPYSDSCKRFLSLFICLNTNNQLSSVFVSHRQEFREQAEFVKSSIRYCPLLLEVCKLFCPADIRVGQI